MANELQFRPAEFEQLPLGAIIAKPLVAAVEAMRAAAQATADYITTVSGDPAKPNQVQLSYQRIAGEKPSLVTISAPLLAMVPVPHLRIDSLTVHFRYEISQIISDKKASEANLEGGLSLPGALKWIANVNFKGHVTRSVSHESTTNRRGEIEITVHASQAEIPHGLQKLLTALTDGVQVSEK